jgi:eukaryotic-like serine/threonine-protein kinase
VRGRRWRERDPSEISAAALTRLEVYRAVAFGLGVVDAVRGMDFIARGARLALRTGEPRRVVLCVAYLACSLASRGAHRSARRWNALARQVAERLDDPYLLAWVDMATGAIGYFAGDFDVGTRFFGAAEDTFRERTSGTTFEINNARLFRLFSLRHAGALSELRTRRDDYLRDAARRGDRYAETSMRRSSNLAWLVADDPAQAAADLESTGWIPPEGVFHVQHWYELEARAELALYVGGVRAQRAELASAFERLDRSMLGRVELVRIVSTWLAARLALAEGGDGVGRARRAARRLRRWSSRGTGFSGVLAGLVEAAVAVADGRRGDPAPDHRAGRDAAHGAARGGRPPPAGRAPGAARGRGARRHGGGVAEGRGRGPGRAAARGHRADGGGPEAAPRVERSSLRSSLAQRTRLPAATQTSQSAADSGTVENACWRIGT